MGAAVLHGSHVLSVRHDTLLLAPFPFTILQLGPIFPKHEDASGNSALGPATRNSMRIESVLLIIIIITIIMFMKV